MRIPPTKAAANSGGISALSGDGSIGGASSAKRSLIRGRAVPASQQQIVADPVELGREQQMRVGNDHYLAVGLEGRDPSVEPGLGRVQCTSHRGLPDLRPPIQPA